MKEAPIEEQVRALSADAIRHNQVTVTIPSVSLKIILDMLDSCRTYITKNGNAIEDIKQIFQLIPYLTPSTQAISALKLIVERYLDNNEEEEAEDELSTISPLDLEAVFNDISPNDDEDIEEIPAE